MATFKPKYRDKGGTLVESNVYWYEFIYAGKRIGSLQRPPGRPLPWKLRSANGWTWNAPARVFRWKPPPCASAPSWTAPRHTARPISRGTAKNPDPGLRNGWHIGKALWALLLPDLTEDRIRSTCRRAQGGRRGGPHGQHGSVHAGARHR